MDQQYKLGLLCLTHLLISADGVLDNNEVDAFRLIRQKENISESLFASFQQLIREKKEREIFQAGIDSLIQCSVEDRLKVFVTLYKLSEVDGRVHVKEIRLLLYSIKQAGIEFDHVVNKAITTPSLLS